MSGPVMANADTVCPMPAPKSAPTSKTAQKSLSAHPNMARNL
jgi:hypothetical protein